MKHRTLWQIWRFPFWVGLLSLAGLLTALFSDGWGDWSSWLALAVPVVVCLYFSLSDSSSS